MFTPDNLDADSHLADHKLTLGATPKKTFVDGSLKSKQYSLIRLLIRAETVQSELASNVASRYH